MGYVRSRKFCCCLPVRLGVFLMSSVGTLGGGAIAVYEWIQVTKLKGLTDVTQEEKIALWVNAVIWTLLALTSFFGLVGSLSKSRGLVALYATALFTVLGFNIVSGAVYLHSLFAPAAEQRAVAQCVAGSTAQLESDACAAAYKAERVVLVVVYAVVWLVMLWGCFIVADYVGQLREQEDSDSMDAARLNVPAPAPAPTTYGAYQAPAPPMGMYQGQYPYNTPQNAFGSNNAV